MIVVIANELPPAVRGRLKLWFIEPRPNVFVSGVNNKVAERVVSHLHAHCPPESGLLIIRSLPWAPGMSISTLGKSKKKLITLDGFPLVVEALLAKP